MPITETTPFPGFAEDFNLVLFSLQTACNRALTQAVRPYWIPDLSESDWQLGITLEEAACRATWRFYNAFPDKRKREARDAKSHWQNHCVRQIFYRAYWREAQKLTGVPAGLGEGVGPDKHKSDSVLSHPSE
jgi:hypothetical protein